MDTADLEIGLHRRDDEGYQLELRLSRPDSPTDDRLGPDTPVQVQFDPARLRSLLLNDAAYGKLLGESLFESPEIQREFHATRKVVESHNWALRIRLFIAPGASELQSLRWETLRDPSEDHCLLTAEQLLFSRYLSSSDWRPVERRPQTDLRALLVIANPSDIAEYSMASLNVVETLDRAKSGFGNIPVTELASGGTATIENVITQLREGYDILYLICHGMLVENEPWLWLEAASGETQRVSGTAFCTRLKELKHRPRLVVLASCQSAGTGKATPPGEAGALTALGPRLAEAGIPAVIAMQGDISIKTIDAFMPVFLRELQRDGQIDRAMAVARGVVRERSDWWMPVLFMRLKDGRLWDISRSEKEPISKQEPISKKEPTGIMKLTGQQYKQLQQALLDAFPTETALQQLVMFELDENLATIASGGNLQAIVFNLIGWAQAQGRLAELIQGALRSNPNNPALQDVATTLHISAPSPTSSPTPPLSQKRPPRTAPQTFIPRDYFENVGGSVYTGPVTIHQGDIVGGDKVGGDKIEATIGDVSGGSQVAIGKAIQQNTTPARATQATSSPRPLPQDAPRVFICYAREDLALARRLYTDLKQAGVKPWMDSEDLLPGQNWKLVIKRVIKESTYLIALLSSRSLSKRGFVQKEIREAWNVVDELPPEEIFIIPVRLDECTPMDERLQELHHIDLFPSYEEGLQRILRVLIPPERMPEATPQEAQKPPATHLRSEPLTVSEKEFKKVIEEPAQTLSATNTVVLETITSIQESKPNMDVQVKKAMSHLKDELDVIAPDFSAEEEPDELLVQAIADTIPLMIEFAPVAQHIAEMDLYKAALGFYKGFEFILQGYQGHQYTDSDFYKFMGHELFVSFFSFLIRESRWETITSLLQEELYIEDRQPRMEHFSYLSLHVELLVMRNRRLGLRQKSIHANLMNERHTQGALAEIVPMQQFMDADFFLFLRSETWGAWSSLYLEKVPRFLLEAKRIKYAEQLLSPLDIDDISMFRDRLNERRKALYNYWGFLAEFSAFGRYDSQNIGSR
jgi:hypothetical protein